MRQKLTEYEALCVTYDRTDEANDYNGGDEATRRELLKREATVKQTLKVLDPALAEFDVFTMAGTSEARGKVQRGLGILDDMDEWRANLAPDTPQAPSMPADQLHPWVWDAARTFWVSEHYRSAVHTAASAINAHLQNKLGRGDVSDDKLIQEAFSDRSPEAGKPRLRISGDPTSPTVQSRQRGAMHLGLGIFFALRNPAAHESGEWPQQEALEQLAALSVLARLIDACNVAS